MHVSTTQAIHLLKKIEDAVERILTNSEKSTHISTMHQALLGCSV